MVRMESTPPRPFLGDPATNVKGVVVLSWVLPAEKTQLAATNNDQNLE